MSYTTPYTSAYSGAPGSPGRSALFTGVSAAPGSPGANGATVPDLPVSDILYGYGEWRDVQPVLRSTIKTLYDTVQMQASTIRQLQRSVMSKADQSETSTMESQLNTKISYSELNEFADDLSNRMVELNMAVSRKPDASEIAQEIMDLRNKLNEAISPSVQRWLEVQADKTQHAMVDSQRQLSHHSGLVSDALEVAARHREVEMEAQKVWVDDQLRKMKKGFLEVTARETSERERAVLSLWKEVRSLAESLSLEQNERRTDTRDQLASLEALTARITQVDMELVQKLAAERDERARRLEQLGARCEEVAQGAREAEARLVAALDKEAGARQHGQDAVRNALATQVEDEVEARSAVVTEINNQMNGLEKNIHTQLQLLDEAFEAEKTARQNAENGIVQDLYNAVAKEAQSRSVVADTIETELKAVERKLAAGISGEVEERKHHHDNLKAALESKVDGANEARAELAKELTQAIRATEADLKSLIHKETDERQLAVHLEAQERKSADDAMRSDYVRVSEDLKADLGATRTDLAAAENFLGERVTRETEERRKAEGLLRGETAAELEALRDHHERRAQEAQRVATEISKELMDLEFSKRDGQFNEMKHHVDFCTKGTADEVIQMWQYVQRIDTDVRDVVLRLDNRMAKIYGRTWK